MSIHTWTAQEVSSDWPFRAWTSLLVRNRTQAPRISHFFSSTSNNVTHARYMAVQPAPVQYWRKKTIDRPGHLHMHMMECVHSAYFILRHPQLTAATTNSTLPMYTCTCPWSPRPSPSSTWFSLSPLATLCLNNCDRLLLSLCLNDRDLPVPLSTNATCDATVETACRVLSCFAYPDVSRLVV